LNRYADLYAATILNLLYYPFSYMFRAPAMLLPHESTVAHEHSAANAAYTVELERKRESADKKRVRSRFHILSESEMVDKCF
jgi:hypothetical protein